MDNEKDAHRNRLLQYLVYALQAYDAVNSAKTFRQGGHETDPLMKPFSHGGAPTMALGFGLQDIGIDEAEKAEHLSAGQQNTELFGQILAHLLSIIQTNRNRMGGNINLNPEAGAAGAAGLVIPLFTKKF